MHDDSDFRTAVNRVMFAIAAGETSATWDLHTLAQPALAGTVRREASRVGVHLDVDDVFGITLDAAMELSRLARTWSPDGALPWVWARLRIHALVHEHLGTFTRELDEEALEGVEPVVHVRMEEPVAALRKLAEGHEGARQLRERLDALVSARDADIWLSFQLERDAGNRSPAVTIAVDHDMQPAAVRKVVERVSKRLAASAYMDVAA